MTPVTKRQLKHSGLKAFAFATLGLALGFFLTPIFYTAVEAEVSCEGSSGNLKGYIDTGYGPVYLSQESWNEDNPSKPIDEAFYVNYDVERGVWSGRGFNEEVGPVDFNYDQENHLVRFEKPGEEYDRLHDGDDTNDEPVEWGNWKGVVDLSNVVYNVQNGYFLGEGYDVDGKTGEGDEDENVGSGVWKFDNVVLEQPTCPEKLNLLINRRSRYYAPTCPIRAEDLIIQWTSEGVENCRSVAGYWDLIDRPEQNTGTDVRANRDIHEEDGVVRFTMRCTGAHSGMTIEKSAVAYCGESTQGGGGGDGEIDLNGIIAPKIIEA